MPDGSLEPRTKGTPQGGVISPLLANLFLHYAFDLWVRRNFPPCPFERYDFLGYTFQPRRAKNRRGKFFVGFLPAISNKAAQSIRKTIRDWRMASTRNNQRLEDLARLVNPSVRGWMNYYGRFYRSGCVQALRQLNEALAAWVRRKYTRFRNRERASKHWLGQVARREPNLFAHWQLGVRPAAGV
jgi:hypothetical protein